MSTLTIEELFERSIKECMFKNFVVIVMCFLFYDRFSNALATLEAAQMGDFLMLISILLVTACFANFAFSYEFSIMESLGMRLLSHISTFIFMLLIALLLEVMVIGLIQVYPQLGAMVVVFSLLLYMGCALYDFWDLFRGFKALYPELHTRIDQNIEIQRFGDRTEVMHLIQPEPQSRAASGKHVAPPTAAPQNAAPPQPHS